MNAVLDVCYRNDHAWAACLTFSGWMDALPREIFTVRLGIPAGYQPGLFYKRELPCLLAVLETANRKFENIIVDGFVSLKPPLLKGLGAWLADSLDYNPGVIGVAKGPLKVADRYLEIRRGNSHRPLYVSSVNCALEDAAGLVLSMRGQHRIPTLIKMADQAARAAARQDFQDQRQQNA